MKPTVTDPKRAEEALRRAHDQTELILSSITSILIGVDQEGLVTHWNPTAEKALGVPAPEIINQSLSHSKISWELNKIFSGIEECKAKGRSVRVDDIRFKRRNGEQGFLGFTIIPLRESANEYAEFILFGADITEKKRVDQLKDEFVSMVSHELRTPLTLIKEGVSQVEEGILGEINENQKKFLLVAMENIDRLGRIVDELLDISKIEAGKLELKRDRVDVISVVRTVQAAFAHQIQGRGLELRTVLPSNKQEIYVDKDKAVQVFVNLLSNALKFTEKGSIEISVKPKGNVVECSVSDTGVGISEADLPKVFTKFQQFTSVKGKQAKGTGLGLAISKGIVEAHGGTMTVQSQWGKGTRFTFSLPSYSARELFRQHIAQSIREALSGEASFSMVVLDVANYELVEKKLGVEETACFVRELAELARKSLWKRADVAMKDTRAILVMLPSTGKEGALIVEGRMQQAFEDYLSRKGVRREIQLECKAATYPEDGTTEEELLAKVGVK